MSEVSPWSVRDDALRIYREKLDWTPEQVADHLGIDPDTVREWIQKNGRLRTIHQPRYEQKLRARRMEVIRLSANGHDDAYIAHTMGLRTKEQVSRLRARSLEKMAVEFRDVKTWEKARALHLARLEGMLTSWLPRALGTEEVAPDPRIADIALKALAQIAQVSGFNTINVTTHGDGNPTTTLMAEEDVQHVLDSLHTLASRVGGNTIDGELAGTNE